VNVNGTGRGMLLLQRSASSLLLLVIRVFIIVRIVAIPPAIPTQATLQRRGGLSASVANTKCLMSIEDLASVAIVPMTGKVYDLDDELLGSSPWHLLPDAGLLQKRQHIAQHVAPVVIRHRALLVCSAALRGTTTARMCDRECHRLHRTDVLYWLLAVLRERS